MNNSYIKKKLKNLASIPSVLLRPTNFCIWHSGRCGSTILSSMLKQHPNIYCAEELLENYSREYVKSKNNLEGWSRGKFLIRLNMLKGGKKVSGFEMKMAHLNRLEVNVSEAVNFLNKIGYKKYIVLERQNYLRVFVSREVAKQTSLYHIDSRKSSTLNQIYIDPEEMNFLFCEYSNFYNEIKTLLGKNCLWLLYEKDILQSPQIAYQKVTDFLKLKPVKAKISLKRTNPYPLEEIILNFDEISDLLKNTDFEWMLKENIK